MNVNTPSIQVANGIVGLVNGGLKTRIIQNAAGNGNPLYVRFGGDASNLASDVTYHVVLAPGSTPNDGLGAILSIDMVDWAGLISVYCPATNGGPRFVYTELT